jgi:ATP-binding cassette subfamily B protein RaxB
MPVILQSEISECGLACLAMILSVYDYQIDMNSMRRLGGDFQRGCTLKDLINVSTQFNLNARPLRVDLDELVNIRLPAILHWDFKHYVVLKSINKNSLIIHDPAVGLRKYSLNEASRHVTGIAIEFEPGKLFQAENKHQTSKVADLFRRYPGFFLSVMQLVLMTLLIQFFTIFSAFFMQLVVDESLARGDLDVLQLIALAFLITGFLRIVITLLRAQVKIYFSNRVGVQLVCNVMSHLFSLPISYFNKRHTGDLISRFGSIGRIRNTLCEDVITVTMDACFSLLTFFVIALLSPMLSLVVFGFISAYFILRVASIDASKNLEMSVIHAESKTESVLIENLRAIEIIKFYCREMTRMMVWRNHYAEQLQSQFRLDAFSAKVTAGMSLILMLENIVVVYLAAIQVLNNQLTIGMLVAFMSLKNHLGESAQSFSDKFVEIRLMKLHLERVSDITLSKPESPTPFSSNLQYQFPGAITLVEASFSYSAAESPIFTGINAEIQPGDIVLISGESGTGKSTLLKVICGLLPVSAGEIYIDDQQMDVEKSRFIRGNCAGVLQSDQLFSGTILDNITLYEADVDHDWLSQVLVMVFADVFVGQLPMGYHSLIGDMGITMSAGQQQRLLLARALYGKPNILFLDEATANLDALTSRKIFENIKMLGVTTIVVTHQQDLLPEPDKRIVLNRESRGNRQRDEATV